MKTTKANNMKGLLADTANQSPAAPAGLWPSEARIAAQRLAQAAPASAAKPDTRDGKGNLPPIDTEARKKNRTLPTPKVLELLKSSNPGLFNLAEVVGGRPDSGWIWVQFRETPAPELRQILAQIGFHWNRERQAWQHPCGQFRLSSASDPHEKYPCHFPADARAN